ncbi:MAG TPA: hypothetical protein VJB57_13445 [Dehalococcoidia bacterium]|nr:hypothetical protein [Dehalococcoidia bacterium]
MEVGGGNQTGAEAEEELRRVREDVGPLAGKNAARRERIEKLEAQAGKG